MVSKYFARVAVKGRQKKMTKPTIEFRLHDVLGQVFTAITAGDYEQSLLA